MANRNGLAIFIRVQTPETRGEKNTIPQPQTLRGQSKKKREKGMGSSFTSILFCIIPRLVPPSPPGFLRSYYEIPPHLIFGGQELGTAAHSKRSAYCAPVRPSVKPYAPGTVETSEKEDGATVDGRNPAPPGMYKTLYIMKKTTTMTMTMKTMMTTRMMMTMMTTRMMMTRMMVMTMTMMVMMMMLMLLMMMMMIIICHDQNDAHDVPDNSGFSDVCQIFG